MRKIFLLLMLAGLTIGANAQPEARRQAQQKAKQQSNANNMTTRAQIMFPTSATMGDDVVWRRDIYRELDLMMMPMHHCIILWSLSVVR